MAQDLNVELREETGRRKIKRLRAAGKIPAVIYGSGDDTVSLSVPTDEFTRIINQGDRVVTLTGGVSSDAFIQAVQWDVFGTNVLHADFTRIAAGTLVDCTLKVELKGICPGAKEGGKVETAVHLVEIKCPPSSLTDKLEVSIGELGLDQTITVGQLNLPPGAEPALPSDAVVVRCVSKASAAAAEASAAAAEASAEEEKKDDGEAS